MKEIIGNNMDQIVDKISECDTGDALPLYSIFKSIEEQLGYQLGDCGRSRVIQLIEFGATSDECVEALRLL